MNFLLAIVSLIARKDEPTTTRVRWSDVVIFCVLCAVAFALCAIYIKINGM